MNGYCKCWVFVLLARWSGYSTKEQWFPYTFTAFRTVIRHFYLDRRILLRRRDFVLQQILHRRSVELWKFRRSINEFAVCFLLLVSSEAIDSRPRTVRSVRSYNLIADFRFPHVSGTRRTDRLCLFIPRFYFLWSVPCCNKVDHAGRRLYAWSDRTMVVKSFPCPVSFT